MKEYVYILKRIDYFHDFSCGEYMNVAVFKDHAIAMRYFKDSCNKGMPISIKDDGRYVGYYKYALEKIRII